MQLTKSDKSKPVEKRGRKAKGLKSRTRDHDSQVAEDDEITVMIFFASLGKTRLVLLEPYHSSFDKGKPVERRGRKAKGLKSHIMGS